MKSNTNEFTQAGIKLLPENWVLLPVDGHKRPVDPKTGLLLKGWTEAKYTASEILSLESTHVEAVSTICGEPSNLLTFDPDGKGAGDTFKDFFGRSIDELPPTLTNTSGKEGREKRFYSVPDAQKYNLRTLHLKGLDILYNGSHAVIMGRHPDTGSYRWVEGRGPGEVECAEAPIWVLEAFGRKSIPRGQVVQRPDKKPRQPATSDDWGLHDPDPDDYRQIEFAKSVLSRIPAKECEGYSDWLKVGICLHSVSTCLLPSWIEWSSQMSNFDEDECYRKWHTFSSPDDYRREKGQEPLTLDKLIKFSERFDNYSDQSIKELASQLKDKDRRITALVEICTKMGFQYDELKRRIARNGEPIKIDPKEFYVELALQIGQEVPKDIAKDSLIRAAKENPFNPVRDYLESVLPLAESTQPVSDKEIAQWFGLEPNDHVSIGLIRVHLRACAIRGMEPGSKMDSVLILVGQMGLRKSSAIKALAPHPSYYDEATRIDIDNKDTLSAMNSAFIFELSEIERLVMTRDSSVIKSWISRQSDNYVEKYETTVTEHPRRCCLFGTTNQSVFLNDYTGSRRFWIVYNEYLCDVDGIVTNRDRLWGHSLREALDGEPYFLNQSDPLMIEASQRGMDATPTDTWLELLSIKLEKAQPGTFVPTGLVFSIIDGSETENYQEFLQSQKSGDTISYQHTMSDRKHADTIRLAKVMQSLGWVRARSSQYRGYRKL